MIDVQVRQCLLPLAALVLVAATAAAAAAPAPRLVLPYDLEARADALYVADGLRHQILRYDLGKKRLTVLAGTGAPAPR